LTARCPAQRAVFFCGVCRGASRRTSRHSRQLRRVFR
jgi:hypothetical protein